MKKILYSAFAMMMLSSVLFMGGCKKTPSVDGKVATITTGGSVSTFSYDAQGRLTTFTNANGSSSIVYSPSTVTITYNGSSTILQLNNQGYASSAGSEQYTYDGNGYLQSDVYANTNTNYSFTGGNLNTIITNSNTTDAYTYLNTVDYRDYGLHFLGKSGIDINFFPLSHNLINTDLEGGVTYQYSYTFDSKGRVQTQTVQGNGASSTSVYTYTN